MSPSAHEADGRPKYLAVVYDESVKPLTEYPGVFARYLADRFGLKQGQVLLDAGCGRAEMINAFSSLGLMCYGCDLQAPPPDTSLCEIAEVDFSTESLPYSDDTFDVVLSKSVLEHMLDPGLFLSEILRVLRKEGLLILLTPDWDSQSSVFFEDPTHIHPYLPLGVERLLKLSGFREVMVERFNHHPDIWRSSMWRALAAVLRVFLSTPNARRLTETTGIKFFRWAVERQVLAVGRK